MSTATDGRAAAPAAEGTRPDVWFVLAHPRTGASFVYNPARDELRLEAPFSSKVRSADLYTYPYP